MGSTSTSSRQLRPDQLYILGDDLHARAFRVGSDVSVDPYALVRAEYRPPRPLVFRHFLGKVMGDAIGTGFGVFFLVSDRFVETLKRGAFTGWTTFPVEVRSKDENTIPGYHGFAVTGRCGRIDRSRGERVIVPPSSPRGSPVAAVRGVYCDESTWDGSDVFVAQADGEKKPAYVFVTEAVKEAIENAGLTNVSLQKAMDVEQIMI